MKTRDVMTKAIVWVYPEVKLRGCCLDEGNTAVPVLYDKGAEWGASPPHGGGAVGTVARRDLLRAVLLTNPDQ